MAEQGKRYYWLKLKDSFYNDDGPADFLMSQKDGANYVVLYQMLCLKSINSGGRLENQIGDYLIRYDLDKIQRIGKYFSIDTVRNALMLYKALGLVYEENDGTLVISDYDGLVGSETDAAGRKRKQRLKEKSAKMLPNCENKRDNVTDNVADNVTIEKENKILRDKDIEIEKEKEEKPKDSGKKEKDYFEYFAGDDKELLDALRDFEKMRNQMKKPMSDRARKMLVNKLEREFKREEWIEVLEQSIFHGWDSVWPLRNGGNENGFGSNKRNGYGKGSGKNQSFESEHSDLQYAEPDEDFTWGT